MTEAADIRFLLAIQHSGSLVATGRRLGLSPSAVSQRLIRRWAIEGRGIILRSEWDVADDIRKGALLRLLPAWKTPDANVVALTRNRAGLPRRTREFMQYLQARFRPHAPWRV